MLEQGMAKGSGGGLLSAGAGFLPSLPPSLQCWRGCDEANEINMPRKRNTNKKPRPPKEVKNITIKCKVLEINIIRVSSAAIKRLICYCRKEKKNNNVFMLKIAAKNCFSSSAFCFIVFPFSPSLFPHLPAMSVLL